MPVMFVEAECALPLRLAVAHRLLDVAIADGGLIAESRSACAEGLSFLMRVGPAGSRRPGKEVRVDVLPSHWVGKAVVVPLRWEATGAAGSLFPSMDANLTLRADDAGGTVVAIVGAYRPPLGALGAGLDRAGLRTAARATVQALSAEIVARLNQLSRAQLSRTETGATLDQVAEQHPA